MRRLYKVGLVSGDFAYIEQTLKYFNEIVPMLKEFNTIIPIAHWLVSGDKKPALTMLDNVIKTNRSKWNGCFKFNEIQYSLTRVDRGFAVCFDPKINVISVSRYDEKNLLVKFRFVLPHEEINANKLINHIKENDDNSWQSFKFVDIKY